MKKKAFALIVVLLLLCSVFAPTGVNASTMAMKNWQQDEPSVSGYVHGDQRGTWWYKMYGGDNFGNTGCGVMALVNAVHYATGNFMDPLEIADWAYEYKSGGVRAYSGDVGTYRELLYPNVEAVFGSKYGFKIVDTGTYGKVSDAKFINHLKNGGTAVVHVKGHFMSVVEYDEASGKFLLWDNCAGDGRGGHRAGATHKAGDWLTADQLEGGLNKEYLTVDWYCLVSSRGTSSGPKETYAPKVTQPPTTQKPETTDFSGTVKKYTAEGKRYSIRIYQNSKSDASYVNGWGGLDGISDKTLSKDAVLYVFGGLQLNTKDCKRVGLLVDNKYIVWPSGSLQKTDVPTREDCYLALSDSLGEHGFMFDISFDTSSLEKGNHTMKLVFECSDGAIVEIGTRTATYGGGCFVIKATSSGSKYVPTGTPKATTAPTRTPEITAEPTAEPTTEPTTAPTATCDVPAETAPQATNQLPEETAETDEQKDNDTGCGSAIAGSSAIVLLAAAVLMKKRKESI